MTIIIGTSSGGEEAVCGHVVQEVHGDRREAHVLPFRDHRGVHGSQGTEWTEQRWPVQRLIVN